MSKMFDANVKHYKEKYHNMIDNISRKSLDAYIKSSGVTDEFFKAGFEENSEQFRQFVLTFAKTLMPGHVSCTTYAAVVSVYLRVIQDMKLNLVISIREKVQTHIQHLLTMFTPKLMERFMSSSMEIHLTSTI